MEPGNLGNAVAKFGDGESFGSDHRPGRGAAVDAFAAPTSVTVSG
jgi:hypothetical protein